MDRSIQNLDHTFSSWGDFADHHVPFFFICSSAAFSWFYSKLGKLQVMLQRVCVSFFFWKEVEKSHFLDVWSWSLQWSCMSWCHILSLAINFLWIVFCQEKKPALIIKIMHIEYVINYSLPGTKLHLKNNGFYNNDNVTTFITHNGRKYLSAFIHVQFCTWINAIIFIIHLSVNYLLI